MWPPFCLTTSCKRTLAFVTTFRHKSSESARHNFTMWAMSCLFLMKNMFNVTTVLPHNHLQTNPCIRHNFSTQVFRKRAAHLHYVGPELRSFGGQKRPENVAQLRAHIVKLCSPSYRTNTPLVQKLRCQTPMKHTANISESLRISVKYSSILPDDGSSTIRNMPEWFLILCLLKFLYNVDFNF